MSELEEVTGRLPPSCDVVDTHSRQRHVIPTDQHRDNPSVVKCLELLSARSSAPSNDDGIHPIVSESVDIIRQGAWPAIRVAEKECVTVFPAHRLDAPSNSRIIGIGDVRNNKADGVGASLMQAARKGVGTVIQLLGSFPHPSLELIANRAWHIVQDTGDRGNGNPGPPRYLSNRDGSRFLRPHSS
jgi:hypothetical protein